MKKSIAFVSTACLVFVGLAAVQPAYGLEREDTEKPELREQARPEQQKKQAEKAQKTKEAEATRKLNKKQQVCRNREAEITRTLLRVSDRAQGHIDVFNKITQRTQEFYTKKGKILDTYEPLVSDVVAKKAAAEKSVANLKAIAGVFTCDTENPQAGLQAVRDALRAKRDTMKAYKTAVKNLIVGVKSVQATTKPTETKEVER